MGIYIYLEVIITGLFNDTTLWTILFEFFKKTMASNLMVEAGSALSQEVKLATLSEEVTRRLRNTSLEVNHSTRMEILERACTKMVTSGHKEVFIRKAVVRGINAFRDKVERSQLDEEHLVIGEGGTIEPKLTQKWQSGEFQVSDPKMLTVAMPMNTWISTSIPEGWLEEK